MPLYGKYKLYKEHKRTRVLFIKQFFKESFKIWDFISYYNTVDKIMLLVFSNDKVMEWKV